MRMGRRPLDVPDDAANMTAFIDVIFQLVLFFVFSLKFLALDTYLHATLPKEGDGPTPPSVAPVTLELERSPDGQATICRTPLYIPPDGSTPIQDYVFPEAPEVRAGTGPDGVECIETTVTFRRGGSRGFEIEDFALAAPERLD